MEKYIVLFNSMSDNNKGLENAKKLEEKVKEADLEFVDLLKIEDLGKYFETLDKTQKFILSGGDGTLNHFVNAIDEKDIPEEFYYFPAGTGNDFYHDISEIEKTDDIIKIKKYLMGLPTTTIQGKTSKFFDNVGYGIDGYCCEVADILKAKSDKPINYAGIAVKGLLFHFKPKDAKITVDGKTYEFKKVWLAPVMKGKYYGGGMIPCPKQDRNGETLSMLVWHCGNKFKTLMNFSKIFKGTHIQKSKMCEIIEGKEFVIEFSEPCAAQIDGETVLNVSKVEVKA